jgi:hypothetical protein
MVTFKRENLTVGSSRLGHLIIAIMPKLSVSCFRHPPGELTLIDRKKPLTL